MTDSDHHEPSCPDCGSVVRIRRGIEQCRSCHWVRPQGAD